MKQVAYSGNTAVTFRVSHSVARQLDLDQILLYRLITSAVDLKLIFFCRILQGGRHFRSLRKKLNGHIEDVFLSKTKDTLTLLTSFENTNHLKTQNYANILEQIIRSNEETRDEFNADGNESFQNLPLSPKQQSNDKSESSPTSFRIVTISRQNLREITITIINIHVYTTLFIPICPNITE